MGEFFVEAQLDMTIGIIVEVAFLVPEPVVDAGFCCRTEKHELGVVGEGVVNGVMYQMNAFLVV